jgi:UDP-N-acetylmuramoyl-tripeptide--D-alanyl-D-alanine ligase
MEQELGRSEELASWCGGRWTAPPRGPVTAAIHDSREPAGGALFFALHGERFDGHDFVGDVLARGAAGAVVREERAAELTAHGPLLVVDDPPLALQGLAAGHRRRMKASVGAVTGSVGKTAVKDLTADVLSSRGPVGRTPGNWNNQIGLPRSLLTLTERHWAGVFEIAMNRPGEIAALTALASPDWGIVTPVGAAHLERLGSVRAVALEKAALPAGIDPAGFVVLPADNEWFDLLRERAACRVVAAGFSDRAEIRGRMFSHSSRLEILAAGRTLCSVEISSGGRMAAENRLLAAAAALELGLSADEIADGLQAARGAPMRWERVRAGDVTLILDAYNANPLSMAAALEAMAREQGAGNRWLVLGGMHELGDAEIPAHRGVGRAAAAGPWAGLIAVGERGRWILEGARDAGFPEARLHAAPDAAAAAARLHELMERGDRALIKASRGERLERVADHVRSLRGKDAR